MPLSIVRSLGDCHCMMLGSGITLERDSVPAEELPAAMQPWSNKDGFLLSDGRILIRKDGRWQFWQVANGHALYHSNLWDQWRVGMTLGEWCGQARIVPQTIRKCLVVPADHPVHLRRALHDLADYCVSSIEAGSVYLLPRKRK